MLPACFRPHAHASAAPEKTKAGGGGGDGRGSETKAGDSIVCGTYAANFV